MLKLALQCVVNGILLGGIYSMMAVGLSLCFGVMRVANSAQAAMAVLSAYIAYWLFDLYGVNPFFSIVVSMGVLFIFGLGTYRVLVTKIVNTPSPTLLSFLLLSAVSIIMENGLIMIGGNVYRSIYTSYTATSVEVSGIVFPIVRVAGFALSIVLIIFLFLILKYTYLGKAMRALAQDREAASLMGVNVTRVGSITFAIGTAMSGVAGVIMALIYAFYPSIHNLWIAKLYCIVIFGGMGSITGAMLASLVLGVVETVVGAFVPTMWTYVVAYAILLLTLSLRPTGLMGR